MTLNVLIACEESQAVCKEFRRLGHRAFSCDILECSGGHLEWHIQDDVLPLINGKCVFKTMDGHTHTQHERWDLIIAHPPCTYLTVTGNRWFNTDLYGQKAVKRYTDRDEASEFFMRFVYADCERIAIENPVGYMNTYYREPDQIIHPFYFGEPVSKATCLWLKGLPLLVPTKIVEPEWNLSGGKRLSGKAFYVKDDDGKIIGWNDPRTARARSKTYSGIAKAIAEQWSEYISSGVPVIGGQTSLW